MKKLIGLLILLLFFTTGCSFKNINKEDINEVIDLVMKEKTSSNKALKGYKFYLPNGMQLINDTNNNNVLYADKEKYYLYVDLVSYYNKENNEYKINTEKESFFSKILNYNDNHGYILVTKYNDEYFVEVMYNYGKIEVISKDYKKAIVNSLFVLNSIEYNDKIIDTLIGTNVLKYDEEEFNLLGPSTETIDFLQEYEGEEEVIEEEIEISD